MKLTELIRTVITSNPDDWNVISDPPTYRDQFVVWSHGRDKFAGLEVRSHHSVAAFKDNLSVTIAWGMQEMADFQEEYANKFADSRASSAWLDLFYNGALVERELYVVVDGGRCYLPLPDRDVNANATAVLRWTVSSDKHQLIKLVHRLNSGGHDYDSYFERSGIEIV